MKATGVLIAGAVAALTACGGSTPTPHATTHTTTAAATTAPNPVTAAARAECQAYSAVAGDITSRTAGDRTAGDLLATLTAEGNNQPESSWGKALNAAAAKGGPVVVGGNPADSIKLDIEGALIPLSRAQADADLGRAVDIRDLPVQWRAFLKGMAAVDRACAGYLG